MCDAEVHLVDGHPVQTVGSASRQARPAEGHEHDLYRRPTS
jgi:hypothetical protein